MKKYYGEYMEHGEMKPYFCWAENMAEARFKFHTFLKTVDTEENAFVTYKNLVRVRNINWQKLIFWAVTLGNIIFAAMNLINILK